MTDATGQAVMEFSAKARRNDPVQSYMAADRKKTISTRMPIGANKFIISSFYLVLVIYYNRVGPLSPFSCVPVKIGKRIMPTQSEVLR